MKIEFRLPSLGADMESATLTEWLKKPGDRIRVRLTCKEKSLRAEKGYGEVRWDTEITNQSGEVVASYDVLTMVSEKAVPDA